MKANGLFHGSYQISSTPQPPSGHRFGGRAFVVPGQGGAYPGMFAEQLVTIEAFRERFAEADRLCRNFDLHPVSFYLARPGALPSDKIHIYRNCAIYVAEVALGDYLQEQGLGPDCITAHSFGECAGLVLAGLVDFPSMFGVVVQRNILAPPANQLGFMVAVSGSKESLSKCLEMPGVYFANRNSHKQSVLSVAKESGESLLAALRNSRVPHVLLQQLPQPYHSPLMQDFRRTLQECLIQMRIEVHAPKIPIFSGVLHQWIDASNYQTVNFVDLVARQATEPVDFVEQLEALRERGMSSFYEVGPGQMLETSIKAVLGEGSLAYRDSNTLIRSIVGKARVTTENHQKLANTKWFQKIKAAIQSVAGYQADEIDITQSFQNDLGLDSIKKAEILFRIIDEEKLTSSTDFSIAQLNTIYQAVEYLENYTASSDPLRINHETETSLMETFWREDPRNEHYVLDQGADSYSLLRLSLGDQLADDFLPKASVFVRDCVARDRRPLVVLESNNSSFNPEHFLSKIHERYSLFNATRSIPQFDLVLVDQTPTEELRPLAAFFKSLRKESAFCRFLYIVSDQPLSDRQIALDTDFSTCRDLRYLNGKRHILDFRQLAVERRYSRDRANTVLAAGGSKGINFEILRSYPVTTGDHLVLLGRRPETHDEIKANIAELRAHWPKFSYVKVDVNNYDALSAAVKRVIDESSIDVALNSCGYERSQRFDEKDHESIVDEFRSKWLPFQNIERLKKEHAIPKVIHYSSLVTEFGNRGQAIYAYSNALIARECARSGSHAIAWGPWDGVGMTENPGIQQRLKEWGASFVPVDIGARLAYQLIYTKKELPPVPFAFDYKDVFLFSMDRNSLAEVSPFTGSVVNAFEASFVKDINVEQEPFLKDHAYEGRPLVSASYMAATFAAIGRSQFARRIPLMNFEIQNLIRLQTDGHFEAKIQAFFRAPHALQIYSVISHCTARFNPDHIPDESPGTPLVPNRVINAQEFAHHWVLDFGPTYQVAHEVEVAENKEIRILVDCDRLPRYMGDRYFDFTLAMTEIALESFTIFGTVNFRSTTVPISFDSMEYSRVHALTRHLKVRAVVKHNEGSFWSGDVEVQNDKGEVALRYVNVKVKMYMPDSKGVKP